MADAVQSNSQYISAVTSGISSSASSASVNSGITKSSFSQSTASCPSLEPNLVETFLGCCKELFRRINEDAQNVAKIGEGFRTMDNSMANTAKTLNMEVKSNRYQVGEVSLGESREADSLTNADVRKQIEQILEEKGADFKLKNRNSDSDSDTDDDNDNDYYWNGPAGSPAPASSVPEATTVAPTEAITEEATEAPSEESTVEIETEAPTEKPTEAATEKPTEVQTEVKTEAKTEVKTEKAELPKPHRDNHGGSSSPIKVEPVTEITTVAEITTEIMTDMPYIDTEDDIIDEPYIEEELSEDYVDLDLDQFEPIEIGDEIIDIPDETPTKKSGSGLGAAVAVVGAAAAIGGAGYAANKYLKKKEEDGSDEDWGDEA